MDIHGCWSHQGGSGKTCEHSDKEHVDKVKDLQASQERSEKDHRREVREYQAQLSEGEKLKASAAKLEELFMNMQKAVDPLKDTQQKSYEQHQKQINEGEKLKVSTAKLEELVTNMQKAVDPLENAKEQQDQISRALAAWTKPYTSGNWKHHGFNVHSITYAGKTYESQSVVDTFWCLDELVDLSRLTTIFFKTTPGLVRLRHCSWCPRMMTTRLSVILVGDRMSW
jgi:myosin heavy subunit